MKRFSLVPLQRMPVVVKLHFSLQVQSPGNLGKLEEWFLGKKIPVSLIQNSN